jgi:CHRD domain-containing protein
MNRLSHLGVAVATLALLSSSTPQPAQAASNVFTTHLTGKEVVPAVETRATGEAKLTLSTDGTQIQFRVNVSNIENVTEAAIHLGMPGQSGEVVAVLYGPAAANGGRKTGVLAEGAITQASLTGSLMGHPVSDLISAIRSGNVYVDISTSDGSTTQKPGNESSGEIRGQVR